MDIAKHLEERKQNHRINSPTDYMIHVDGASFVITAYSSDDADEQFRKVRSSTMTAAKHNAFKGSTREELRAFSAGRLGG